jgi:hypothetical protein
LARKYGNAEMVECCRKVYAFVTLYFGRVFRNSGVCFTLGASGRALFVRWQGGILKDDVRD